MSTACVYTPENRLAKILQNRQAPAAHELISDADARVVNLAVSIREFVGRRVEALSLFGGAPEDELFAEARTIGQYALDIAEVAAAAGLNDIGDIARGMKAMVDGLVRDGIWHSDALRLHIHSLMLASRPAGGEKDMVEHLFVLRQALHVTE